MLKKFAVRFILNGRTRTYVLNDIGSVEAICTALDLLEVDVPQITTAVGLAVVAKAFPAAESLLDEECGPVIDTTKIRLVEPRELEAA